MRYVSTRDNGLSLSAAEAIVQGLSRDGGLFVPSELPPMPTLDSLVPLSYPERAAKILSLFTEEFSEEELLAMAQAAYSRFDTPTVAPVHMREDGIHFLELWHGPTCAFKDMALQMLPRLLTASLCKIGENREAVILAATSGDTGKAALEGFRDVEGTRILTFYPKDGVARIQELQMVTQEGGNVGVCAVRGNFDDCQTAVKAIFSDEGLRDSLDKAGKFFSSANSINWGRVLPQIVYYFSAYCDLVAAGRIHVGDTIHFCVPTGNFGNILSAYYARKMGLPIGRLICASNRNNVLTDFIETGVYDKERSFHCTLSPSMDILVSSNLERALYDLCGCNAEQVKDWMSALGTKGRYEVSQAVKARMAEVFSAGFCDDKQTKAVICQLFESEGYCLDPHTAVGFDIACRYREKGDNTPIVVVSTASPFKFCDSVLDALGVQTDATETALIGELERVLGQEAPQPLKSLKDKAIRFTDVAEQDKLSEVVSGFLFSV